MNKTAIEWLWLNLTDDMIGALSPKQIKSIYDLVQQAKAIEKEQIIEAFKSGEFLWIDYYDPKNPHQECSENYFNETYNQTKNDDEQSN